MDTIHYLFTTTKRCKAFQNFALSSVAAILKNFENQNKVFPSPVTDLQTYRCVCAFKCRPQNWVNNLYRSKDQPNFELLTTMDLEKYKELSELNEKIYDLKLKNAHFEEQKRVFDQIGAAGDGVGKLNFVSDFVVLISQNLKKMSALTLTLMNQSEETSSSNNVFKLRKELKSVLLEYLQRIVKFTLQDGKGRICFLF